MLSSECNIENMRLFVAALRSGEFPQGTMRLARCTTFGPEAESDWKYCCLGVACEIALRHGVVMAVDVQSSGSYAVKAYDHNSVTLPLAVQQWLGIGEDVPMVRHPEQPVGSNLISVIRANDDLGWDFEAIADALDLRFKLVRVSDGQ